MGTSGNLAKAQILIRTLNISEPRFILPHVTVAKKHGPHDQAMFYIYKPALKEQHNTTAGDKGVAGKQPFCHRLFLLLNKQIGERHGRDIR